ncbi:hypothetical protein EBB59_05775 [Lysobacter pythonis]|uniref:Uncharacterized protein n=1 Tax=Solilutibacter pythonis TaxID=2483112 RepID=A0A3M2I5A5_9GAMM|nr:hypothetical protein [Lysobacter pythonis]RMH93444.1 hypothetical protein EBB59_05775 [Lysobacter pythonis]
MRRLLSILPLSLGLLVTPAADALTPPRPHLVSLQLLDREEGRVLPAYPHRGERWVAGQPGHRYAVRLVNHTDRRVLVVLSVDGVNAVTGETAAPRQSGYVLAPRQSTEIEGWRKSMDEVAQFVFTRLPDSYAARTGRPDNVGVVGIAVFEERMARPPRPAPVAAAPAASAVMEREAGAVMEKEASADNLARQRVGTGHGEREWSPASRTDFIRASRAPAQIGQLRYDHRERLAAMGILPRQRPWRGDAPRAFPGGFVPDPPRR